ncbi:hypothetical protein [Paenibacillus tianjinensis]|uniref:Uncharacterized protein n=1 Tax=Paenibacillus tianjinensis TaxID=2810347 RepID=A0ABX7L991_9BACL|nr:hypothetical protein [Paenibacillus tianjinensis]QSF43274.1 hypothetical protein JRJ22_18580 [Paenibacillus tianjinensis]
MSVEYSALFSSFLGKLEEDAYEGIAETVAEQDMIVLLNSAIINFTFPKIDVFDKDDLTMIFNQDITIKEIEIMSNLMRVEWLNRKLNNINLLKQKFSDKEFKLTSQAAHMEALLKVASKAQEDVKKMMNTYSLSNNGKSNFGVLRGGD